MNRFAFYPDTTTTIPPQNLPPGVQEIFIKTEDGKTLQCFYIYNPDSDKILIYFHGNAGNITHRVDDLLQLSKYGPSVLGISYRGYGKSDGKPSEKGIYRDGQAALSYCLNQLGYPLRDIFILGRSIGTTVAITTSQHKNLAGLILITPLTSGKDYAKASGLGWLSFVAGSSFRNIDKIKNISCPVLILHGTADRVIPCNMGAEIHDTLPAKKKLVTFPNAGHNDISLNDEYWISICDFLNNGL